MAQIVSSSHTAPDRFSIRAKLNYSQTSSEQLYLTLPGMKTNMVQDPIDVKVTSSRGLLTSLDKEGFESFHAPSKVKDWNSEEEVKSVYYQEAVELVKRATGANVVTVFDHTFRRADGSANKQPGGRDPVFAVHADYTIDSAEKRLNDFYLAKAEDLRRQRWAIVNVWRPISGVVKDLPLGFIDASTTGPEDLSAYNLVLPDRVGQNQTVHFNPNHKWYFYEQQTPDEAHIFKQYDTKDGVARFTPHTGFEDPSKPDTGFIPRESIELRLFVFYDLTEELPIIAELPKAPTPA